ncbi:MAG: hypothetical protein ABI137_09475 [Antricoccus sp.]
MTDTSRNTVHTVLLYSPRQERRAVIRSAIGRRPAGDLGRLEWVECATYDEVIEQVDRGDIALAILDGEAQPIGGMGLSRQMKYELTECPAVVVVIARADDRWLATWSLADATLTYPVDPIIAGDVIAEQLRNRAAGVPVLR